MRQTRTPLEKIVELKAIASPDNPIDRDALLRLAWDEPVKPAGEDRFRTLLLLVDPQMDFMEGGSLGVPGSIADAARTIHLIDRHLEAITKIMVSLDTHDPFQIFHPCWWTDRDGHNPPPFTTMTAEDVDSGRWLPVIYPEQSRAYVRALEENGRQNLVIWPYHCLQGTAGCAMENQLANMIYFHSVARRTVVHKVVKGQDSLSEMYGIVRPENDDGSETNEALLQELSQYDRILVAGQAKSHCVLETLRQILDFAEGRPGLAERITLMDDCTSSIPGFESATDEALSFLVARFGIHRIRSTDL